MSKMTSGDKEDARRNWKKAGHGFAYLSDDIILEILSRLDLKELPRLRCVCKLWSSWIATRRLLFVCSHMEEQYHSCQFSSVDMNGKVVPTLFDGKVIRYPWPWSVQCYSNDLPLVLVAMSTKDLYICYPSKGELVPLPDQLPPPRYPELLAAGLGYVSATNEFKVVRILDQHKLGPLTCQVLTIGGTNSWQKGPDLPYSYHVERSQSVFFNGVIYFAPSNEYPIVAKCIFAFDLEREDWGELPLPVPPTRDYEYCLTLLRGLLCLVEFCTLICRRPTKLWILKDRENVQWVCDNTIENFAYAVPLQIDEDGRVLIHFTFEKRLLHYNPKEKSEQAFVDVKYINAATFYLDTYLAAH